MSWLASGTIKSITKLGLVISLLALILFSCDEYNQIGEDLIKDQDAVGVLSVELPVGAPVMLIDSVFTRSSQILAGGYEDSLMGKVQAEGYSGLLPVDTTKGPRGIDENATYDSLTLTLRVSYLYGDNVFSAQPLRVYQLADSISLFEEDELKLPYGKTPQEYHNLLADTSLSLIQKLYEDDSLYIRLKLSDEFGQSIFDLGKDDSAKFTDNKFMKGFLKGLAITQGENTSRITGFDIDDSEMTLHYHTNEDTIGYKFNFTGFPYSFIESNRTGTALEGLTQINQKFYPADDKTYMQNGVGLVTFLDFSAFQEMADTLGRFIVNNAQLYIKVDPYPANQPPPDAIYIYATDSTGELQNTPRGQLTITGFGEPIPYGSTQSGSPHFVRLDNERRRYTIDLTLFVQNFMNEDGELKNLLLYPYPVETMGRIGPSLIPANRVNRFSADLSNIRLKIYYTTLK